MLFPAAEWLPDQPDFNNPGASTILNVIPRTAQSYGPFPSLTPLLNALASRCQGAAGVRDSAGNTYNFAGTASKLYKSTSGSSSWSDVTLSGAYSASPDEQWHFISFGDNFLACQISDPIQSFVLGSSSAFADLSSDAPKCRFMTVAKDFLIVGNTNDATNGACPQRVWWPAIGDPTNWPTLGTTSAAEVQSDAQDVVGDHGWLTGLVANVGTSDATAYFERAIFRMMYVGAPDIWGFYPQTGVRGCPVSGSIQRTELGVIFLGPDDFYLDTGGYPVSIGNQKIAKTFYSDVDQTYLDRICSALDPINKLYYMAYPSLSSSGGVLDTLIVGNYGLTSTMKSPVRWSKVKDPSVMLDYLFIATSFGYNVDTAGNTGYNTDTSPFGPDSRFWTGNANILSGFDSSLHKLNYFSGSSLAATVETSERQLLKNGRAAFTRCRPIIDGGSPTVTPYTRNRIVDSPVAKTASLMDSNGNCFHKDAEGFYHRQRITVPAGSTFTHLQGVDVPDDCVIGTGQR